MHAGFSFRDKEDDLERDPGDDYTTVNVLKAAESYTGKWLIALLLLSR